MKFRFIDREKELQFLKSLYEKSGFQFIIIHGRRRVGKTTLLREFIKNVKRSVYLTADLVPSKLLFERFYRETTTQIQGRPFLFESLDDYFKYICDLAKNERFVLIIDEFQYVCSVDETFLSQLQRWIDQCFQESELFLILCGSEIRMMQELFGVQNPLHGRRTGQLKIKPVDFLQLEHFFPTASLSDLVRIYAAYGGVPAYLVHYNAEKKFWDNLKDSILNPMHFLFEEPEHLLRQEFRDIRRYWAILHAIALGERRLVDIANTTGIEARTLPKYLTSLLTTDLLVKKMPIGIRKPKTKQTLYKLKDNFLNFWFRYVFPYKSQIELENADIVIHFIKNSWDEYLGQIFEEIAYELIVHANALQLLPIQCLEIGSWWKSTLEIDIVGLSQNKSSICFFEVKWNEKTDGQKILKKLEEKIESTPWVDANKKYLAVIARGFKRDGDGQITFDDLYTAVKKTLKEKMVRKRSLFSFMEL